MNFSTIMIGILTAFKDLWTGVYGFNTMRSRSDGSIYQLNDINSYRFNLQLDSAKTLLNPIA